MTGHRALWRPTPDEIIRTFVAAVVFGLLHFIFDMPYRYYWLMLAGYVLFTATDLLSAALTQAWCDRRHGVENETP